MKQKMEQVKVLLDALPYIQTHKGEIFVIKYGGSAQIDPVLKEKVARDILLMQLMGIKTVIVHGGGKKIGSMLDRLAIESHFIDGLRVTDRPTMEIVEMVLSGSINKEITALINKHKGNAIGISGKDANLLTAIAIDSQRYGYVGNITHVNHTVITNLLADGFIPVIAPVAADATADDHPGYNINADLAASKIAASIGAKKVIFMTDIPGVLDKEKKLLSTLTNEQVKELKENETITGGMIPKVDACLEALNHGVEKAHIIDGRVEHALLLELFTSEGVGTVFK